MYYRRILKCWQQWWLIDTSTDWMSVTFIVCSIKSRTSLLFIPWTEFSIHDFPVTSCLVLARGLIWDEMTLLLIKSVYISSLQSICLLAIFNVIQYLYFFLALNFKHAYWLIFSLSSILFIGVESKGQIWHPKNTLLSKIMML